MNQEQFNQFLDKIKGSSDSFSMEGNWVFTQFSTPEARIIYGDINGTWKDFGVFHPKQLALLAVVRNDGTVFYNEKELLHQNFYSKPDIEVKQTESCKSFSAAWQEFLQQAEDIFTNTLSKQIPDYPIQEGRKDILKTNARKHLFFNKPFSFLFEKMQDYILPRRENLRLLCGHKSLEDTLTDNFNNFVLSKTSGAAEYYKESSIIQNYITHPQTCCEPWELQLAEKVRNISLHGGRTVTVTFPSNKNINDTTTIKYDIDKFLTCLAYYHFPNTLYTNNDLLSVTYRDKELLKHGQFKEQVEEESITTPPMTM